MLTPLSKSKIWQCFMHLAVQRRCVLEEKKTLRGTQSSRWMILLFSAILPRAKFFFSFLFQAQMPPDSASASLFLFFTLGFRISVSPKSSSTPVWVQMALWSFSLRDLAFLTHQQLFHTEHTVPNLRETHHQPTPQYFHQSSAFVNVSFFYLSPSLHLVDCYPIFFSPHICPGTATEDRRWREGKKSRRVKNNLKPNNG